MDLNAPVSARQFAKMVGIASDNAVRKAVERGSILRGYNKETKKFIPAVAAAEWGKDILPEYLSASTPAKRPGVHKAKPRPAAITADQVVSEVLKEKLAPQKKTPFINPDDFGDDLDFEDDEERDDDDPNWISKPEAERRTAIHKSEILQIALAEKRGQLIPKEKISTILFGYGQEIRVSFEGLTNRVLDRVLAAETRNEAKRILDEEIHATLTALAEITNRNI